MASAVALEEINHAMLGGKGDVRTMSGGDSGYSIEYKDGRKVEFVRVDGAVPVAAPAEEPEEWSTTHSGYTAHRFNADNRALCNRSVRPRDNNTEGSNYGVRSWYAASAFRLCPRCDAKD
ncbi:hypothetical protein [Streptomyces sp. NPDC001876]|uniref:hypothetical protein n=1 Tax=Streptomyces sp. NPDC001876 TaxID=3154402 RepID=UPI0033325641